MICLYIIFNVCYILKFKKKIEKKFILIKENLWIMCVWKNVWKLYIYIKYVYMNVL